MWSFGSPLAASCFLFTRQNGRAACVSALSPQRFVPGTCVPIVAFYRAQQPQLGKEAEIIGGKMENLERDEGEFYPAFSEMNMVQQGVEVISSALYLDRVSWRTCRIGDGLKADETFDTAAAYLLNIQL
ncbi:hypothetical protein Q7C36_010016 [Tachysurus vachellii]|uniref:Uncharacterized protein n=1 Tax=Tachysurus vachellii TaxID=175792 RepID=A0AA88MZD6_TACVA|nr:hypothetical protein Q7C36_010016 [Tachysurus vachellii]